jgi:RNA polymerase sigma factor (sigma-70 family)
VVTEPASPILRFLRTLRAVETLREASDADLLARFVARRDPDAFTAIVRRHGLMVWGVCWRTLHDRDLAEDAFQATFLVLVRRSHAIRKQASVGSWLYGVAARIALKARAARQHRRRCEHVCVEDVPAPAVAEADEDVLTILLQEIQRLPERYRAALVLCDLEGRTHAEAAAALGCPRETVTTRLVRARERLRAKLTQRGVGTSSSLLTCLTLPDLPGELMQAATQTAFSGVGAGPLVASARAMALAKGAITSMTTASRLVTIAGLTLATISLGAAAIAYQAPRPEPNPPPARRTAEPTAESAARQEVQKDTKPEERKHGFLGVILKGNETNDAVLIHEVFPDSPAAKAGIKAEEVLVKIDGKAVTEPSAAVDVLKMKRPGEKIALTMKRADQEMVHSIVLAKWPAKLPESQKEDSGQPDAERGFLGLKLKDDDDRVVVGDVVADSPAAKAGIKADDVIVSVNKKKPQGASDVIEQCANLKAGDRVVVRIKRGDTERDIAITAAKRPADFGMM